MASCGDLGRHGVPGGRCRRDHDGVHVLCLQDENGQQHSWTDRTSRPATVPFSKRPTIAVFMRGVRVPLVTCVTCMCFLTLDSYFRRCDFARRSPLSAHCSLRADSDRRAVRCDFVTNAVRCDFVTNAVRCDHALRCVAR